jgi:hypothetical protein
MNIVTKNKCHYSHVDLSFLLLHVYIEFSSENYRDRGYISCEHTCLFDFFSNLEI